jgi:hypothetical protein
VWVNDGDQWRRPRECANASGSAAQTKCRLAARHANNFDVAQRHGPETDPENLPDRLLGREASGQSIGPTGTVGELHVAEESLRQSRTALE